MSEIILGTFELRNTVELRLAKSKQFDSTTKGYYTPQRK
jgi:hypothetical protein